MFQLFGTSPSLLITEVDTWSGFYAAMAALQQPFGGKFKRVVCAVRNKNKDWLKYIEKLGGEIKEYNPVSPGTIDNVMQGIDSILLIAVHTEKTVECTNNIIEAAQRANSVKYLLFWSYLGASYTHTPLEGHKGVFHKFAEIEQLVKKSKIENECVFRNGFIVQNFFAFSQIMQNKGIFPLTSSSGKMAPVSGKDVSTACVTLLHDPKVFHKYNKQTFTLTGPVSYNGPSLTQVLNRTLNTRIEFEEIDIAEMQNILESHTDSDPFDICVTLGFFELLNEGKLDLTTRDIENFLNRPPSGVEEFFQENQDAFKPIGALERLYLKELHVQTL